MAQKLTNGEKPHSITIDHLFEYPLLSQSFDFYQKQPLGAKSLDIANNIYQRTAPLFATPASYIAPYASKLDGLGDSSLATVDKYVPAVKQTDFGTLHSYATAPFSYVFNTYNDEYKKTSRRDGEGIVSTGKAFISTELRIAAESLQYVANYLGPKKDEAGEKLQQLKGFGQEKMQQAQQQGQQALNQAGEKAQQAKQQGYQTMDQAGEKAQQAKQQGLQAKDQAKEQGQQAMDQAGEKGQQAKKQGQQKKDEVVNGKY